MRWSRAPVLKVALALMTVSPLCKMLLKSRDGGDRLGKPCLYIEDPALVLTALQNVRPPETFSMYVLLHVRSLRGFVEYFHLLPHTSQVLSKRKLQRS